jgi:hypothetical protein
MLILAIIGQVRIPCRCALAAVARIMDEDINILQRLSGLCDGTKFLQCLPDGWETNVLFAIGEFQKDCLCNDSNKDSSKLLSGIGIVRGMRGLPVGSLCKNAESMPQVTDREIVVVLQQLDAKKQDARN